MARGVNRLSARKVQTITKPGRHADGGNLYLIVDPSGAKRWLFLFRWEGKLKEMGLGGLARVSLAEARELAADARATLGRGRNPIDARREERAIPTFGEIADDLVGSMEGSWKNPRHRAQWKRALTVYAEPLRAKPVDTITTEDVLVVLKPLWQSKPETASRLRGRIERVLAAAKARGLRSGENPALWRGHLSELLPPRRRLTRGHHAAMAYTALPEFVKTLRARPALAALALEFTILTAVRTDEALGAAWSEMNLDEAVWTIPPERRKLPLKKRGTEEWKPHRVPLSDAAMRVLRNVADARISDDPNAYVFPGQKAGRPLSGMAMSMLLRRMEVTNATVHGMRSALRDWAGDKTAFPRELAEAALSHAVGDATERAYRRSDALAKRRDLMEAWANYLDGQLADNVVALRG